MTLLPVSAGCGVIAALYDPEPGIAMAIPIEPRPKTDPVRSEPFAPAHCSRIVNPEIIRETLRSIDLAAFEAFVLLSKTGQEPSPPRQN